MESVDRTPTEPADYALLSAIYGTALAGTALSARKRDGIPTAELPMLAAASFALSKLIVKEKVESWMRRPFVDEDRGKPKGRRLRYAVGELLTCTRCSGAWSALGLVALRVHAPGPGTDGQYRARRLGGQRPARTWRSRTCARTRTRSSRSPRMPSMRLRVQPAA